ncbi:MAG: DUF1517 domain-containing protein [Myxococcales bacterium]|nr:DUF1517 domain-containing protein [Myxococcales bacterium]
MRVSLGLLLILWVAAPASAQTGGSFGSNDFGGGSSGSSGSSSGGGSWESSGSSGSGEASQPTSAATLSLPSAEPGERYLVPGEVARSDAERDAKDRTGDWVMLAGTTGSFLFFGLVFGYGLFVAGKDRYAAPEGPFEVRRVSVAFDWTARARIQEELARAAASFGPGAGGRRVASAETARALASACGAARYGAFQTFRGKAAEAEARFQRIATDLRARYRHETAGARAAGPIPEVRARADEGEGLVVVTMIVGWNGHMPRLPARLDPGAAAAAFAGLSPTGPEVVALEVIWSPALDQDRMSSAELEMLYPELVRLDAGTDVGRFSCTFCHAVYPSELGQCPACGAPRLA